MQLVDNNRVISKHYTYLCRTLKVAVFIYRFISFPAHRTFVNIRFFQNLTQDYPKSHGCLPATITFIYFT